MRLYCQQDLMPYYGQAANPFAPQVTSSPSRIQTVLSAGAVRAACDKVIRENESAIESAVKSAIDAIAPLPETTETVLRRGWFRTWKETICVVPSEEDQRKHRALMEENARGMDRYYPISTQIKTLFGLSSHLPPDQLMPLEGDYVTAIAKYLEPISP